MKKVWTLILMGILFPATALAQGAVPADTAASREDIVQLFALMQVQQQTRNTLDAMMKQQRAMVGDVLKKRHPELSDEQMREAGSLMDDFWKDFPVDQLLDDMIPVYQRHLTKADVQAMSQFYASATGKKLLGEMPAIMTESMQAMMPHLQEAMEKMMDRVEKKAQERRTDHTKPPAVKN